MSQLIRHRHKQKTRLGLLERAAGLEPLAVASGSVPSLLMRDPEDARSAIISGSITTLLHAGALVGLAPRACNQGFFEFLFKFFFAST